MDDSTLSTQQVSNPAQAAPATTNTPATPTSPSTSPAPPAGASGSPQSATSTGGGAQQPASPASNAQPNMVVSNPGAAPGAVAKRGAQDTNGTAVAATQHPSVARASVTHQVARALAGNPTRVVIDPDGTRREVPVPMTGKQIALAIAMEAISGSLTGLAAGRGRGPGAAGAAGFNQQVALRQQQQARQDAQAQEDFNNRTKLLASKAATAEVNSRSILNTAEAEKYGADAIDKAVEINRASGILDVDPALVDNGGQPMTQAEMMDGIKAGKIGTMDKLGPMAGRVLITAPDGSSHWEATHLILRDPDSKMIVSKEQWDRYVDAHVPGFPNKAAVGPHGTDLKLSQVQNANEVMMAHHLADTRLNDMRTVLAGTAYADKVPSSIDFSKPGVEKAIQRFQKYVSHSDQHGSDIFQSLQAMGADKRDPKSGQMQPNPDAKFVDLAAAAMGGWPVLEAVHNQLAANKKMAEEFSIIDSEAKANAVLANPHRFTRDQVTSAQSFLSLSQQQGAKKAAQEARDRAVAEGKDYEGMLNTGRNPITGERLTLDNAPDEQLVDTKTGLPIPKNMLSTMKPTVTEIQRADFARSAMHSADAIADLVKQGKAKVGPFSGPINQLMAKAGLGDTFNQELQNYVRFAQSAATAAHTGRFSVPILEKMSQTISPNMNENQLQGAITSIHTIMQPYADAGWRPSVAEYKATMASKNQPALSNLQVNPHTGQQIGWDGKKWVDVNTRQAVQ